MPWYCFAAWITGVLSSSLYRAKGTQGQRQTQTKWAVRAKQSQLHEPSCGGNRGSRTHRKARTPKSPALTHPCSALPWDTEYPGSTASFSCFRDGTQNRISCVISRKQIDKGKWLRSLSSLTWNILLELENPFPRNLWCITACKVGVWSGEKMEIFSENKAITNCFQSRMVSVLHYRLKAWHLYQNRKRFVSRWYSNENGKALMFQW